MMAPINPTAMIPCGRCFHTHQEESMCRLMTRPGFFCACPRITETCPRCGNRLSDLARMIGAVPLRVCVGCLNEFAIIFDVEGSISPTAKPPRVEVAKAEGR